MKREAKVELKIEQKKKSDPIPTLVTLGEFILSVSKQHTNCHESLGGFVYWIKKEGCPKRWPVQMWKDKFDQFLSRKT
jgi:hypothetical protein